MKIGIVDDKTRRICGSDYNNSFYFVWVSLARSFLFNVFFIEAMEADLDSLSGELELVVGL